MQPPPSVPQKRMSARCRNRTAVLANVTSSFVALSSIKTAYNTDERDTNIHDTKCVAVKQSPQRLRTEILLRESVRVRTVRKHDMTPSST